MLVRERALENADCVLSVGGERCVSTTFKPRPWMFKPRPCTFKPRPCDIIITSPNRPDLPAFRKIIACECLRVSGKVVGGYIYYSLEYLNRKEGLVYSIVEVWALFHVWPSLQVIQ